MTDDVVLYQFPRAGRLESLSPFCVKIHLALHVKGVTYETKDLLFPWHVRKVNARGRLPAASFGGQMVVDSSDILTEIEKRWPEPRLVPEDPVSRAHARVLEDWADEVWYFYLLYWRWKVEPPHPSRAFRNVPPLLRRLVFSSVRSRITKRLAHQGTGLKPTECVIDEIRGALDAVSSLVESSSGFLLGDRLTIADIALFAQIDGLLWDVLPRAREEIRRHGPVVDWYKRVDSATRGRVGRKGDPSV